MFWNFFPIKRKQGVKNCFKPLIGPSAVAGRVYKIGSVRPSVCPSILPSILPSCLSRCFLGIVSLVFSKFWHDARNPYEVVRDRAGFPRKKFFAPKTGKVGQKWVKIGFLNILKNFVINFY